MNKGKKPHIYINAPVNGTLIIVDGEKSKDTAIQLAELTRECNFLKEQIKAKDNIIKKLDEKLKELEQ